MLYKANQDEGQDRRKHDGAFLARPGSRWFLAVFFCVAGLLHFLFPMKYAHVMPPWLPAHMALVLISGAFEIAGGLGLLWLPLRRAAGIGLLLLCVAVLPANLQMWIDAIAAHKPLWQQTLFLLRLPLQLPLMLWIWRASRS